MAEINKIKFSSDLQKALFPDNSFYKNSLKEDGIEIGVTSVEIPIAGDIAAASEGEPTSLPLKISLKEDSKKSYDVKLLYAGPVLVTRESEIVTSYAKFKETINQFAGVINSKAADYAAHAWGPSLLANMVLSTGTGTRTTSLVGATGTSKKITKADIISVKTKLSKMNLTMPGSLFGLVTPDMYQDLLEIAEFVDYDKTGNQSRLAEGYVGKILGFEISMRWNDILGSIGLHYTNAGTPVKKANGTVATTDRPAGLFWHSGYVRHAEGNPHTSINRDKAEYLGGSIISSMVRFGATPSRTDEKGVVALIEDEG